MQGIYERKKFQRSEHILQMNKLCSQGLHIVLKLCSLKRRRLNTLFLNNQYTVKEHQTSNCNCHLFVFVSKGIVTTEDLDKNKFIIQCKVGETVLWLLSVLVVGLWLDS